MVNFNHIEGFTTDEIVSSLHSAKRKIDFRFELYDANGNYKKDLTNILDGSVKHSADSVIKRTATFTMTEDEDINFLSDRIKPYVRFFIDRQKMSPAFNAFVSATMAASFDKQMIGQNGWIEFPLGEFLLTSPLRKENGPIFIRDVECYDGCLVLQEDKFAERHFIPAGMSIKDAVVEILEGAGITRHEIQDSIQAVEVDLEFAVGDEKLAAINQLLLSGGYQELYTDNNGVYISNLFVNPLNAPADYAYKTDRNSVVFGEYEEQLDYYNVPNKWIVVRTMADKPPLTSSYTNTNPNSPTSTVNRNRTIVKKVEIDNIPDQFALDLYVERLAFEDSQVYGVVNFQSAIMPFHTHLNVLDIEFDGLIGNGKYLEMSWEIPFSVGGEMSHSIRRISAI